MPLGVAACVGNRSHTWTSDQENHIPRSGNDELASHPFARTAHHRWFGENASFLIGAIFVAIVLFLPYGLVGSWRVRSLNVRRGWAALLERVSKPEE